ncbi:DUF5924 family protein [Larsenimonas rhizosphaerae]|uniref:DUF5924 family protein n=1 Tax=Larsenimonas rhizosphaerae TaxID=2944682 RepID=A0AA42CXH8_9GAMM|nr:DUF5924 family protein [Larsenimonas rhizosphaerae]MCX2523880.1 DUF5924 family protein [Larsenimonas rhizosphaerae]
MEKELALPPRIKGLVERLQRYHYLWPCVSFISGILSFFLVTRQQSLGGFLAVALLASWALLIGENIWSGVRERRHQSRLPKLIATFVTQLTHQETLCFCLPFFLVTTAWSSGQAVFTGLLVLCTLISVMDPVYFRLADRVRWLYMAFHGLCAFILILVSAPLLLHVTTGQSFLLATLALPILSLPSLINLFQPRNIMSWLGMLAMAVALSGLAWSGRSWVPPATLWITSSALSPSFNQAARSPEGTMALTSSALEARGLYAYTAIHAPRGLNEKVFHVWRHEGKVVDRIPLTIKGTGGDAYRAWSHKLHFPRDSAGPWQVDVITADGQRIGVIRFNVSTTPSDAGKADGTLHHTPGVGWLSMTKSSGG